MTKTHTNRAIDMLEAIGWTVDVVERHIPYTNITNDLFGFADVLAVNPDNNRPTLAVQVTDHTNVSHRVTKLIEEPRVKTCLLSRWRVEVWGIRDKPDKNGSWLKARNLRLILGEITAFEGSSIINV